MAYLNSAVEINAAGLLSFQAADSGGRQTGMVLRWLGNQAGSFRGRRMDEWHRLLKVAVQLVHRN